MSHPQRRYWLLHQQSVSRKGSLTIWTTAWTISHSGLRQNHELKKQPTRLESSSQLWHWRMLRPMPHLAVNVLRRIDGPRRKCSSVCLAASQFPKPFSLLHLTSPKKNLHDFGWMIMVNLEPCGIISWKCCDHRPWDSSPTQPIYVMTSDLADLSQGCAASPWESGKKTARKQEPKWCEQ